MKPLSVEMACLLGIQKEIQAVWAVSITEALNEICFSFSFTGWNFSIPRGNIYGYSSNIPTQRA